MFGSDELYDVYALKPWAKAVDGLLEDKKEGDNRKDESQVKEKHGNSVSSKPDSGSGKETREADLFKLNTQYLEHLR
ncbi:hypothetical protein ACHAWX_000219 [Stephanocyclus meneghinianus]